MSKEIVQASYGRYLTRVLCPALKLARTEHLVVSTDWLLIAELLYCIVIAVQKHIIIAVYCACEIVAFHQGICTFRAFFLMIFMERGTMA